MHNIKVARIGLTILLASLLTFNAKAQEFECQVEVLSPAIQLTNKQIFETMKTSISNFMNATKFTQDNFKTAEKIKISMVFTIDKMVSQTEFSGSLQFFASRPVYGAGYNTTTLRMKDDNIAFTFREFEQLEFIQGAYTNNLTSILAFYAYYALGMDYDTFSELGGTTNLNRALEVANAAQSSEYAGWSATSRGRDNRYWLIFRHLDDRFQPFRKSLYQYHRLGLDKLTQNLDEGRASILKSLETLKKVHNDQPNTYLMQVYLESKRDEIINIFSKANRTEKNKVMEVVETIDIANSSKYRSKLMN